MGFRAEKIVTKLSSLLFVAGILFSCTGNSRYYAATGYAQGGTYTVKMNLEGVTVSPEKISRSIDSLLTLIDTTLSGYNRSSLVSRFNEGEIITPNEMFRDIFGVSRDIWEETDGAVDVAAGPLFDAWGFGFSSDSLPSESEVKAIMERCGMALMDKDINSDIAKGHVLNYNAIAQGYSCDVIAKYLYSIGVKDMLVDIGEIFCDGLNPSGKSWNIGIDKPIDGNQQLGAELQDVWASSGGPCGIVTSGNYRKFYIRDGKKYAHTIDPRTGFPVEHNLLSATIVAPSATMADAYATYCMVIGLEESKSFIEGRSDLEGYLIYDEGGEMKTWFSPGFNVLR
ncbi:MAG: FAD:protein FMN transferase [Bacteroidales bacterium]|nr:FAD:protein FMN transferase [Bacteroidales bacterium]